MNAAASPTAMRRFTVNPLQRAWLRELGLEKAGLAALAVPSPASGRGTGQSDGGVGWVERERSPTRGAPGDALGGAPRVGLPASAQPTVEALRPIASGRGKRPVESPRPLVGEGVGERVNLATLDLNALCERVLACEACGLHAGRKHAVFGTGVQTASWLIVGEAPGEQEDRQGLPFVGRSGQLLDAMLAAVGRSRDSNVYIANVIKCRPPGNRNPRPEEIAACRPYLMRQIALLKPECIVVMGRFAAQTLLASDAPLSSLRGRVHRLETEANSAIPVVVSYHPAYLLRSPREKAKAWADLQLAVKA